MVGGNSSDSEGDLIGKTLESLNELRAYVALNVNQDKQNLPSSEMNLIILIYSVFIIVGSCENAVVMLAVLLRPNLRNARNLLIFNLSLSDLWLCLVTMPITLTEIKWTFWPWDPESRGLCKLLPLLTSVSVFVSTLSITAIALDRMWVICYPHKPAPTMSQVLLLLPLLWLLGFAMSYPQVHYKELVMMPINSFVASRSGHNVPEWLAFLQASNISLKEDLMSNLSCSLSCGGEGDEYTLEDHNLLYKAAGTPLPASCKNWVETNPPACLHIKVMAAQLIDFSTSSPAIGSCNEQFPGGLRFLYSLFTMIFQYVLPAVTIAVANGKIFWRLQERKNQTIRPKDMEKRQEEKIRMTRAKSLLFCIGLVFLLCWIPINCINLLSDGLLLLDMSLISLLKTDGFYLIFTLCHCSAMVCAVINPMIYGFFNENFRREFLLLREKVLPIKRESPELPLLPMEHPSPGVGRTHRGKIGQEREKPQGLRNVAGQTDNRKQKPLSHQITEDIIGEEFV